MEEKRYEEVFARRLNVLWNKKGVSARDMSLSIGQNAGYINYIENGKALPSMSGFFFICEYLGVTPSEFFDDTNLDPQAIRNLEDNLRRLTPRQLQSIATIVEDLTR